MSNPQKRKGDQAERDLVAWMQGHGYPDARRTRAGWDDDLGDVNPGWPEHRFMLEVKNRKALNVNTWLDELAAKVADDGNDFESGLLVVKRPGLADPGDWWAIQRVRWAL